MLGYQDNIQLTEHEGLFQCYTMKYYQLKRAAEDRKRWHGLVVNLVQETTLR